MSVRILTAEQVFGCQWTERYPSKRDDLWVVVHAQGKRVRRRIGAPTPDNRVEAERAKKDLEHELAEQPLVESGLVLPRFDWMAQRFLERGIPNRAANTQRSKRSCINGLLPVFGARRLDKIQSQDVIRWWTDYIDGGGRDYRTGRLYLITLSGVFRFAAREGYAVENPVPAARDRILPDYAHTAEARGRDERNRNPLTRQELEAFVPAVRQWRNSDVSLLTMLLLDAGLRLSEGWNLTWDRCWFGRDDNDTSRHIELRAQDTKSGRSRRVAMSRRLRAMLLAHLVVFQDVVQRIDRQHQKVHPSDFLDHGVRDRSVVADVDDP